MGSSASKVHLDGKNMTALLEAFKDAVYMQHPIYKVSTRRSVNFLERKISPTIYPLVRILKRILFKPPRKKKVLKGYSVLQFPREKKKQLLNYDFQVNLPNGLTITTLPRKRELVEVKQLNRNANCGEKYRIFYATGMVLIKNSNGTITIYKSNGDIIHLTEEKEECNTNCMENMKNIFEKEETKKCPFKPSRYDTLPVIKDEADFKGLSEFGGIPYTMKTLLDFNGKKITVTEGKVAEAQVFYVLNENDYHSEETYFEREDGFRCLINKKGERIIQFPDGTKITACPRMEKELIFFTKNPKAEGWVSVVIDYKFEHPSYVSLSYDALAQTTNIFLKDGVIQNFKDSLLLTTEKNIALEVSSEYVIFLKTCDLCDCDCICKINLNGGFNDKLLQVCDSYNKYFACDREGNCEIHADYIKGSKNKNKCDHRWKDEDKRMFILNSKQGPPGTLLWRDSVVEEKMYIGTNSKNVKILNYINRLTRKQTIEFFTEIYQKYNERFTMTHLYDNISLSKNKKSKEKINTVFYVTFRILNEFQNLEESPDTQQELIEFINTNPEIISHFVLNAVAEMANNLDVDEALKDDRCSYRNSMQEIEEPKEIDSVSDNSDVDKVTVAEIIDKWRRACDRPKYLIRKKVFPCYFDSDYYQHVLRSFNVH